jgi:hypothetical protein
MKYIVFIGILLISTSRSFSQDSLYQSTLKVLVKDFSEGGSRYTSYKKLPKFIRKYLDGRQESRFKISKILFNSTDAGWGFPRKLYYVEKKGDNYILSYEHGGLGNHFHSIIFETNGKEVIHVYNLTTLRHRQLNNLIELIEKRMYNVYDLEV